jgi:hemolysin III
MATIKKIKKIKRPQSLGEEIANSVSHGAGAVFGIVSLILTLLTTNSFVSMVASMIFSFAIILLFLSSTLYHAFPPSLRVKRLFKRFDHISIYVLIGASFAPLLLLIADQPFGFIFFTVQWVIITIGVIFKAVFIDRFQVLHLVMFLLLGWSALLIGRVFEALPPAAFILTISGGLAYSFGVIFYGLSRKIKYSHFVWHLFVLAGVILHFLSNYLFIFLPLTY